MVEKRERKKYSMGGGEMKDIKERNRERERSACAVPT